MRFRSAHFLPAQNALVKKPALVGPFAYLSTAAWSNFPLLYRVHRLLPFTVGTSHSLRVSWYKNCRINFHNFRGTRARGPKPFPLQCRRPPTNEGPGAGRVARSPDLTPAESPETSGKHGSQKRAAQRALLRPLQPQRYFQLPPDHDIAVNARPRHRQNRAQNALWSSAECARPAGRRTECARPPARRVCFAASRRLVCRRTRCTSV